MTKRIAALLGLILAACVLGAPTASAEPADRPEFKAPFECGTTWDYFTREGHQGGGDGELSLDFNLGAGDEDLGLPVLAAAAGTAQVRSQNPGAGDYVVLDHGNGWESKHFHLDSVTVEDGAEVKQGEQIGTVGKSGGVDFAHLHYEQHYEGNFTRIWLEGEELALPYGEENEEQVTSTNCGGDGEPDPEPKATELEYNGDTSISNGSPAEMSATLKDEDGEAVVEREVEFELGSDDSAQTCTGTTNDDGKATCPIDEVDQPLTDDATVPVTAAFEGDDEYEASESETVQVKQQYVTGRAFGLSADLPILILPVSIDPTPDTGSVRTAEAVTKSPECAQEVNALVLSAGALCAEVKTEVGPNSSTATSTVADVSLGLPGLPVVELSGVTAKSSATCSAAGGSVDLELSIAGTPVTIPDTPDYGIDLGLGTKLVVNEQTPVEGADKGLTVNAVHLTAPGGVDVVIGSSTSAAHNCA